MTNYERIEKAILFINEHHRLQPELDDIARHVQLSPFHFQRMFRDWAGVSPKKFLQYINARHAKELLQQRRSLADVAFETGLSGTGRLHDLFITIEGMTPGEYKNGGQALTIHYSFAETPFGPVIIASTAKGVCHLAFFTGREQAVAELKGLFPNAQLLHATDQVQQQALQLFSRDWSDLSAVSLHLKGTPFQLKVWETLLKIPAGGIATYAAIAGTIAAPNAQRAVGTAVGANPVAYLIPCHRVILSTGIIGNYHWGTPRKTAMLGWEAAQAFGDDPEA